MKQSTARCYEYPTKSFVQFCESHGITNANDVGSYELESWKEARTSEVKLITVRNNVKHNRVFIKWCSRHEYVERGLHELIEVPNVPTSETVSEVTVQLSEMEHVLRYLQTYEYGDRQHALFYAMWHSCCRISGAMVLDVEDVTIEGGEPILRFRDRPETGTPLKNRKKSERNVSISNECYQVLRDYIEVKRHDVTDEYGRRPLFTTRSGRLTRQRAYKDFTGLTRPCVTTNQCPHDRVIPDCK